MATQLPLLIVSLCNNQDNYINATTYFFGSLIITKVFNV